MTFLIISCSIFIIILSFIFYRLLYYWQRHPFYLMTGNIICYSILWTNWKFKSKRTHAIILFYTIPRSGLYEQLTWHTIINYIPSFVEWETSGRHNRHIYVYLSLWENNYHIQKNNYILLGRWHRRILHCFLIYFTFYHILMFNWADSNDKHVRNIWSPGGQWQMQKSDLQLISQLIFNCCLMEFCWPHLPTWGMKEMANRINRC